MNEYILDQTVFQSDHAKKLQSNYILTWTLHKSFYC